MRVWLTVIVACLAVAGTLGWYKYQSIQAGIAFAAAFPERVEAVEAFTVLEELWQPTTQVIGEAVAIRSVTIKAEIGGTIAEVGFTPGATVQAGQLLTRLDNSEERAQLQAAEAEAKIARLELERSRKLIAAGLGVVEDQDRAQARFEAATAAIRQLQAVIAKKTLRAPFDAAAGLHELDVGQFLDKGDVVARLIGTGERIWIDFTLPQEQANLAIGETIEVARDQTAAAITRAEVIAKDSFVNELSRSVRYRALAENQTLGASPGSLVTVLAPLGDPQSATLAPANAVRRDAFGAKVFVLREAEEGAPASERAEQRMVTLGPQRGGLVVIASGLRPGERVAADGAFKLRDGALVNAGSWGSRSTQGTAGGG